MAVDYFTGTSRNTRLPTCVARSCR